ncbi:MAG: TonB-dependent receptor [Spirochaetales bacterium]|nr:TonB-dependent receptor [Spirochaetales bacterium]
MNKNIFSCFFLIIIFILTAYAAFCEEADVGQVVVTDTRIRSNENADMPEMFTTVINVAADANAQSQSLSELLKRSSDIHVKNTGGESGVSTVTMRGSSSKNVLILIDNIPINTDSNSSGDLNLIPTGMIDRIEITRGGASSEYGSSAMGGVINIITKSADSNRIEFHLTTHNFRSAETAATLALHDGDLSLLAHYADKFDLGNYLYKDDNGTAFNKDDDFIGRMSHNAMNRQNLLIKNAIKLGSGSFGYGVTFTRKQNEVSGPTNVAKHYAMAQLCSHLLTADIMGDLGQSNPYFTAKFDLRLKNDGYIYDDPSTIYSAPEHYSQNALSISQNATFLLTAIPFNLIKLTLRTGYETLLNNTGIFGVSLMASIRDDIPLCGERIILSPVTSVVYYSDMPEPVSFVYNLGATFKALPELMIKTNTWRSYRRPDYTERYYTQGLYIGNPDLKPEISYGGDVGVSYNHRYADVEAVGFCSYYTDLISYILSHGFVYRPINVDQVLSFGCEFKCSIHFIKYFSVEFDYSLNFVNEINDLTQGIFRQQVGYPLNTFFTKLSIDIMEYHFGVQLKFEDDIAITSSGKTIPCKGLLDAFLRIDMPIKIFGLNCSICVNANNLLNIYTFDERNYPLEGRNFILSFILSQDTKISDIRHSYR